MTLAAMLLALASCSQQENTGPSQLDYGISPYQRIISLLPELNYAASQDPAVKWPICISVDDHVLSEDANTMFLNIYELIINNWLAPMQGEPNWSVASVKPFLHTNSDGSCPNNYLESSNSIPMKVYKIHFKKDVTRSHASAVEYKANFSYDIFESFQAQNFQINLAAAETSTYLHYPLYVINHELGHQLGLADIYFEVDRQILTNQPDAVMNRPRGLMYDLRPAADDIAGLKHIWRTLNQFESSTYQNELETCAEGYTREVPSIGRTNTTYCYPNENETQTNAKFFLPLLDSDFKKKGKVLELEFDASKVYLEQIARATLQIQVSNPANDDIKIVASHKKNHHKGTEANLAAGKRDFEILIEEDAFAAIKKKSSADTLTIYLNSNEDLSEIINDNVNLYYTNRDRQSDLR